MQFGKKFIAHRSNAKAANLLISFSFTFIITLLNPGPTLKSCKTIRDAAVSDKTMPIVPECRFDGTFNSRQCTRDSSLCWCSLKNGKPVPGSDFNPAHDEEPNCDELTGKLFILKFVIENSGFTGLKM